MDFRSAWESELKNQFGSGVDGAFLDWLWGEVSQDFSEDELSSPEDPSSILDALVSLSLRPCKTRLYLVRRSSAGGRSLGDGTGDAADDLGNQIKFDPKTRIQVVALSEYLTKIASVERRVMEFRRRFLGATTRTLKSDEIPKLLGSWSLPDDAEISEHDVFLYWVPEGQEPTRFRGAQDSAIGKLDHLGDYFADRYPWNKDQVMHFVLCGQVAQTNTIKGKTRTSTNLGPPAHIFHRATISLEIESWMPPELVKKAYAKVQRELHGGRRARRGEERNTEIFRFVLGRSEVKVVSEEEHLGKLLLSDTWRGLRESWDEQFYAGHDWRYGEHGERNFYRDFMRGQQAVTGSKWGLPGLPGLPMTQAEAERWSKDWTNTFLRSRVVEKRAE